MKEILFKLWRFLTSRLYQFVLGYIAFKSWNEANKIKSLIRNGKLEFVITDGKALAMGLITCSCIIGIVWLEVNRLKQRK